MSPAVLAVLRVLGIALVVYLLVYLGVASKSVGSALAFALIVGSVGLWFFRSVRGRQ